VTTPLCYCTNVHPCHTAADVPRLLDDFVLPIRRAAGFDIAVGLWLPEAAGNELLAKPEAVTGLGHALADRGLSCHTLNAFPQGDFHDRRVKEQVYLPDWSDRRRLDYTLRAATVLAGLVPPGREGSVSTVPLGFKLLPRSPSFMDAAIGNLLACAVGLERLREETGRVIRVAIEPEPLCLLETTPETLAFFGRLHAAADAAGCGPAVRVHVGLCYDICHQAVEFEEAGEALTALAAAGIRIVKVHVSCAIELEDPADAAARGALARHAEPRYLHQTFARTADGRILRDIDLSAHLAVAPPPDWLGAAAWRTHFHVPVNIERLGPLRTTRRDVEAALAAVARLGLRPHIELETYTWPVLAGTEARDPQARQEAIVAGLARELAATRAWLAAGRVAS